MKNRFFWRFLLTPVALLALATTSVTAAAAENLSTRIDAIVASAPDFSGVVLVADHGRVLYHRAFGWRDFSKRNPIGKDDIFELASVTKQFTAMTIMMLHEAGKLNYEDSLEKYIPGLPYPGITIRHLLNHTSGLPEYLTMMEAHWDKSKVAGNADVIAALKQYKPERKAAPGVKYEYSNLGYILLASITEKVSGQDYLTFCRQRIFGPVGMTNTSMRTSAERAAAPSFAWGHKYEEAEKTYVRVDAKPANDYNVWLGNRVGPGRISSTAPDLLKWDQALYAGKLVKPATLAEAYLPGKLNDGSSISYAFGWMPSTDPVLGRVVQHSGGNPGYVTQIVRYLDAKKTVIILCNNAHSKFRDVLKAVEDEMKTVTATN